MLFNSGNKCLSIPSSTLSMSWVDGWEERGGGEVEEVVGRRDRKGIWGGEKER